MTQHMHGGHTALFHRQGDKLCSRFPCFRKSVLYPLIVCPAPRQRKLDLKEQVLPDCSYDWGLVRLWGTVRLGKTSLVFGVELRQGIKDSNKSLNFFRLECCDSVFFWRHNASQNAQIFKSPLSWKGARLNRLC